MSNIATDTFNNDRRALFASLSSNKATMVSFHLYNNAKNITELNGCAMNIWLRPIATSYALAMHFLHTLLHYSMHFWREMSRDNANTCSLQILNFITENSVFLKMKDLWQEQFTRSKWLCLYLDWDVSCIILELL